MSEEQAKYYVITNNARGGRMILTPTGGATIFSKQSQIFSLTENELKAAQPYFDNKDLEKREATAEEIENFEKSTFVSTGLNATPSSNGATSIEGGDTKPGTDIAAGRDSISGGAGEDDLGADVTHVQHLGFGRWFGMKGDEKVTEAMTKAEAESFAQEHSVPIGAAPDPSEAPAEEAAAEEPAAAPDETAGESTESATET